MFNSFPASKRRSPLPTRNFYISHRETRAPSLRVILLQLLAKPKTVLLAVVGLLALLGWILGIGRSVDRTRTTGGVKVVARDWEERRTIKIERDGKVKPDEMILILCPMKNSIEHIWHFFHLIDSLTYPRHLIQIGVLVSDSTDRTYARALELADERQYSRPKSQRYDRISIFRKDFADEMGFSAEERNLGGKERHKFGVQVKRRKMLAVSRTWLLGAAMRPEVDWALWMDVDVVDYEKDMLQTLLGWSRKEAVDVVVPNCAWKTYNEMGSYDRNNWAETPESLEMKSHLAPDDILIEGYEADLPTHRLNMADMVPPTASTPNSMALDGVGGCTALVRASLHRKGAVFPAWPVDHQVETEGFAQLAKALGGRLLGLPKYYVYHGLYG
ncbi:Anp1-domain-containing protein [Leucosporidium creatinivorum]|uniref:Anp1-domain-containing protein n=1 Tax=Leucosporidium creatinivorum TaxID=106004 RepID=A0A1Y2EQ31_9BASI|nr:Anp1-domain-containing protein [Leucosporidium creatinivorum]